MQTVLLAAGEGTRMRPLTATRPKPMLPVAGEPLAAHTARAAVAAGASRLVIVVGYEADRLREYFGREFAGVPVEYAIQSAQRGTADAVAAASNTLTDAPFAVLNGDALYDTESLGRLYDAGPAVGSYRVDDPSAYGVLQVADGRDDSPSSPHSGTVGDERDRSHDQTRVTGVVEKPPNPSGNLVNTGAYVFPATAQDALDVSASRRGELELTDVLNRICDDRPVTHVPFDRWLDVGRPWELLSASDWKVPEQEPLREGSVHETAQLRGHVVVREGARIDSGVVIEGPAYVGPDATVGPNAYVRGTTALGRDATVGHSVEIKNSLLMDGATVGHLSYVGDSVLGRNVNFGAGTTVANLRHDGEPVETRIKGERVSTGRRKFGVVCGDGVKTGIQTSLNAGVQLPPEATTLPGERILSRADLE